jgi:hypothetical protein
MEAEQREKLWQEFDERVEKDPLLKTAMTFYEIGDCKRSEALMAACIALSKLSEELQKMCVDAEVRAIPKITITPQKPEHEIEQNGVIWKVEVL